MDELEVSGVIVEFSLIVNETRSHRIDAMVSYRYVFPTWGILLPREFQDRAVA
jgi:hypothetical protein